MGLNYNTVNGWCNNRNQPYLSDLVKVAELLEAAPADLYWDAIGFVHLPSDPLDTLIDVFGDNIFSRFADGSAFIQASSRRSSSAFHSSDSSKSSEAIGSLNFFFRGLGAPEDSPASPTGPPCPPKLKKWT
jgi:hypothetical protein